MNGLLRIGGVMRCCMDVELPDDPQEGAVLMCPHGCGDGLKYRDGAWEAKWITDGHQMTAPTTPE